MNLTIGMDFDHTFTADPKLWSEFVRLAKLGSKLEDDPIRLVHGH